MSFVDKFKQLNDLRSQAKNLQQTLSQERVETQKNGVTLVMDGNQKVISITIDQNTDIKQLEDLLPEIFNQTVEKIQRIIAAKMQAGGINLPGF